uniref:Protein FAM33A n=1 Tax=Paramormyrops kingsleyae TaxID=1676925 RepID=A0A3B3SUF8_9TELE
MKQAYCKRPWDSNRRPLHHTWFQKAEADLEYVEKQLKFEFMSTVPGNGEAQENPVKLLENLSAIKARHKSLCGQIEEIAVEQKQSVEAIKVHLNTTVQLVQELQLISDYQLPPLTDKEQEAAEFLCLPDYQLTATSPSTSEVPADNESQPPSKEFEELSEVDLEAVPRSVRSNVKLADLNAFYKQLFEHFVANNSGTLNSMQMKKMNMKLSEAKLKTLKHLSLIEVDKKGCVRLATRD